MAKFIQYSTKESQYNGPFDSKVGWAAPGMGDLIVTDNGKIIVIDGGCNNDAESLLSLIKKSSMDERPIIDLWIITHAHGDHDGALNAICKNSELSSQIIIKEILYYFPEDYVDWHGEFCNIEPNKNMKTLLKLTGAKAHCPFIDEIIEIDGIKIQFVYVPYDVSIIQRAHNTNMCSLIFTVEGKSKKVMVTGDAFERTMYVAAWRYGSKLKCDILQLPHHGFCDSGNEYFYKKVNAPIVLIPTSVAGDRAMHSDMYSGQNDPNLWSVRGYNANLWAENNAQEVYKSFNGTFEFEI